jgi:hypothetical protein
MKRALHVVSGILGATRPQPTPNSGQVARALSFALLLAGTLLLPTSVRGTSVVALIDKTNHLLVIAADCRVNRPVNSISKCKIIEEPGCTVAIAGLYQEGETKFDLRRLVAAACQYSGDLRDKADAFLRFARKPYEAAVRHIRNTDPSEFNRTIQGKPTEVIFAGLLRGHLTLLMRGLVSGPKGEITAERSESADATNSSLGYFVGLNRHIREYVTSPGALERLGYREAARRFVETEISANPDLAGPPISELEIDDRGTVHWISRGACEGREAD